MPAPTPTLIPAPRTRRTRAALIAAGLELLVDRPIDGIAIDEIVALARVAKGSFFNHFADKYDFANAVAADVRIAVEARVAHANAAVTDPVERIAGGMRVAAGFALDQPRPAMVLLRSQAPTISAGHPLNAGLKQDLAAALEQGLLQPEARGAGLLYWLGLCQVLMINLIETRPSRNQAEQRLAEMLLLGLRGLGVADARAQAIARPGDSLSASKAESA